MFQQPTPGPAKKLSPIFERRHPLLSATGLSSKSANRQKQQQERLGAGFAFRFGVCWTAASLRISTWTWRMAILSLKLLKYSPRRTPILRENAFAVQSNSSKPQRVS